MRAGRGRFSGGRCPSAGLAARMLGRTGGTAYRFMAGDDFNRDGLPGKALDAAYIELFGVIDQ